MHMEVFFLQNRTVKNTEKNTHQTDVSCAAVTPALKNLFI